LLLLDETEFYKHLEDADIDEKRMAYNVGVGSIFSKAGAIGDLSKFFLRGKVVIYLFFSNWKLRKQPFFNKMFKI